MVLSSINVQEQANQIGQDTQSVVSRDSDHSQAPLEETNDAATQKNPLLAMQLYKSDEVEMKHVIAANRDSYLVFDDMGDSPKLLRTVTGAHSSDISCIRYSFHLSLVATGSSNGTIAVWDYESSQLQSYLFCHKDQITSLHFLEPRALLLSTGLDARVCIWTVRPAYFKERYICLH